MELSTNNNRYLALMSGKKIKELDRIELYNSVLSFISRTYFEAGQIGSSDKQRINEEAKIFCKDLLSTYPNITIAEVSEAFSKGVRKCYGEYYGLSIVTYNDWVRNYYNDPARRQAISNAYSLPEKTEPTADEIAAIEQRSFDEMLNEYKKYGKVMNLGNARYKLLVKRGLISETAYLDYMEIAERKLYASLNAELENAKSKGNRNEWRRVSAELEDLIDDAGGQVKQLACDIAVNEWVRNKVARG